MSRFTPNFTAAIAAIVITFLSMQAITFVPQAPVAAATLPALA